MRIAIITDIHEDVISLEKALRNIEMKNPDKLICLGDISGFSVPYYDHHHSRNASKCLELVRNNCDVIVLGNHDYNASNRLPLVSPEFQFPHEWYKLDYQKKKEFSGDSIWLYEENELNPLYTESDIKFLNKLDENFIMQDEDNNILFTHYFYPNPSGMSKKFYYSIDDLKAHFKYMKENLVNMSVVGHSHPGGLLFYSEKHIFDSGFKKKVYPKEDVCFVAPSVTLGGKANGFMIIDTTNREVEAVKI